MKKFLSLVLALVMTMSLVTVSAGAKDFTDSDELSGEQYEEAVNVMSEMGIIDGYAEGDFRPQGTLTRQAAAKIIACMMLGKTTAESLGTSAAPFKDVPAGSKFAGYIAFCVERGLIDGYGDGTFRPTNTLTGFAFLKMLLGALGYDSDIEGYTGTNWTVNVAGRAYEIGLTNGNKDNFTGSKACTREEAALYAVNTLKATLVEYADKGSNLVINGIEVVQGASEPTYVVSSVYNQATSINADRDNSGDYTVEFAERYQPDLKLTPDTDDFERPARTWSWKNREIGTYLNYDQLVAEYTTGVTGRELYELLTATTIREYGLDSYVDAKENTIAKTDLVRSNTDDVDATGNGVLTQVFVDNDGEQITITSINTWLAQATANYNEKTEAVSLKVYDDVTGRATTGYKTDSTTYTVDAEEVSAITDLVKDEFVLVNISFKDSKTKGAVVAVSEPETMSDVTVTQFSKNGDDDQSGYGVSRQGLYSSLTTGGTKYDGAMKAYYDADVLDEYNNSLLTDNSYNVYLDQYGYVIGVDLYEGTLNYVFITGYDRSQSNLAIRTADAGAIFTDGSMKTIEVNVTDTNKNIAKTTNPDYFQEWKAVNGTPTLNRWYTYTVDKDGVYTLKPANNMMASSYASFASDYIINCNHVVLDDVMKGNNRAYGEDASVYITVDEGEVDTTGGVERAITDVTGVYTGVQDVSLTVNKPNGNNAVYTVYDGDRYVIASIVVGEAQGNTANYAYILSGAKSEGIDADGNYLWTFDAILGGEIRTLTIRSEFANTIQELDVKTVQSLRFDGDYVVKISDVDSNKIVTKYTDPIDEDVHEVYNVSVGTNTSELAQDNATAIADAEGLYLSGRTLYVDDSNSVGLTFVRDAKAVVIQKENNKTVENEYASVDEAMGALADVDTNASGLQFRGRIVAVLNEYGVAEWVVFISRTPVSSGSTPDYGDTGVYRATVDRFNLKVTVTYTGTYDEDAALRAAVVALENAGYELQSWDKTGSPYKAIVTNSNGGPATFEIIAQARA